VLTIAVGSAIVGYLASAFVWRFWTQSRWRNRQSTKD